jgi:ethylmalonyl-CoA mutase
VVLSKNARARAVQLPAWNEALGLPRPFDQQWSLRMQQIMAYETDLLEYDDLFDGNPAMEKLVARLAVEARAEIAALDAAGGMLAAVERGAIKEKLVEANTLRLEAIERGERIVVGVNAFGEGEASPFPAGTGAIQEPSASAEAEQIAALEAWRDERDGRGVAEALKRLKADALGGVNIMPASIEAAKAGATTGEWAETMRAAFGEYRAPTGLRRVARQENADLDPLRAEVERLSLRLGRRVCLLVGKPGLDGHSNGAEQIAARAIDAGFDVVYEGIRSTPDALVEAAKRRSVHCVGLSVLSGAHVTLAREVAGKMRATGLDATPLVVGGVIPEPDARVLLASGVAAIYTPKDYKINAILKNLLALIEERSFGRAS